MSPARMSRFETAIRLVLEFNEAFNRHDVPGMLALLSDDCLFETADGAAYAGKEAVAQFLEDFFRQSPRARLEIEETFSAGLRCVARWKMDNEGKGLTRGVDIFKISNGEICERRSYLKR